MCSKNIIFWCNKNIILSGIFTKKIWRCTPRYNLVEWYALEENSKVPFYILYIFLTMKAINIVSDIVWSACLFIWINPVNHCKYELSQGMTPVTPMGGTLRWSPEKLTTSSRIRTCTLASLQIWRFEANGLTTELLALTIIIYNYNFIS